MFSVECDVLHFHFFVEEEAGTFTEFSSRLGGEVLAGAATSESRCHLGMAVKIVLKAGGNVLTLGDDLHSLREILADFVEQEGVVGAAEYDGVNLRILCHQFVERVFHEVVSTRLVELVVLDEWNPHGTGLPHDGAAWVEFLYFKFVGFRFYGSFGGKNANVFGL